MSLLAGFGDITLTIVQDDQTRRQLISLLELLLIVFRLSWYFHWPSTKGSVSRVGRPPVSRPSLLRALIYKNIRCFPSLTKLVIELKENPAITQRCGFDIRFHPPNVERFSTFLRNTPNSLLQQIRCALLFQLVQSKEISGKYLATDSCPIKANVKENNLKTVAKDRFDKTKRPKGDPEPRLGIIITFPNPNKKKIEYFWGYRNHIISDALSELPVAEITKPANVSETAYLHSPV